MEITILDNNGTKIGEAQSVSCERSVLPLRSLNGSAFPGPMQPDRLTLEKVFLSKFFSMQGQKYTVMIDRGAQVTLFKDCMVTSCNHVVNTTNTALVEHVEMVAGYIKEKSKIDLFAEGHYKEKK